MKPLGDLRKDRVAGTTGDEKPSSKPRIQALALSALLMLAFALPASAASDDSQFEPMSRSFRYSDYHDLRNELQPASFSYRRVEEQSVAAPTQFRIKSILKYQTPLGDTGLVLKLSAPLKLRKLVKLTIKF